MNPSTVMSTMMFRSKGTGASPRDPLRGDASFLFNSALSIYSRHIKDGRPILAAQKKVVHDMASALWRFVQSSQHPVQDFIPILAAPLGSALSSMNDPQALDLAKSLMAYIQKFRGDMEDAKENG